MLALQFFLSHIFVFFKIRNDCLKKFLNFLENQAHPKRNLLVFRSIRPAPPPEFNAERAKLVGIYYY